jgi:hypothetical protein
MKKSSVIILTFMLSTLLLLVLSGCAAPNTIPESNTPLSTVDENTETATAENIQNTGQSSTENEAETVILAELGCSIEIPASWENLYIVEVHDIVIRDMVEAYILHKPTNDEKGWLYSQLVEFGRIQGYYTQERPPILSKTCTVLANVGGYTFYYYTPNYWDTDIVAWHEESASEMSASYLELRGQLSLLVDSFKVIESALPTIIDSSSPADEEFSDETLGISLTFPAAWAGLYSTDIYINEEISWRNLSIRHKATNEMRENSGNLLTIIRTPGEDEYDDDYPPVMAGSCWILEKKGGYTYTVSLPSDVQYDETPGSTLQEEYLLMKSQLNVLLRSFRVND